MTRNEFLRLVKTLLIAMLCGIPVIIVLSILLAGVLSDVAMICINIVVLIIAGVIGYFVRDYLDKRTKRKREEYLASQQTKPKRINENGTKENN